MAKKKNIVISTKELEPTVLATIETKKKSIFGFIKLIVLFTIFIGVVIYLPQLPDLEELYQRYILGKPVSNTNNVVVNNDKEEQEPEAKEPTIYDFNNELTITNEEIKLLKFTFANGVLSFNVANLKEANVDLRTKKYYLNIFNAGVLVTKVKIAEDNFSSLEEKNYTYSINTNAITHVSFEELTVNDYTEFSLTPNEQGIARLICKKGDETLQYTYTNNSLTKIINYESFTNAVEGYESILASYQAKESGLNSQNGVIASLNSSEEAFNFRVEIDTSVANISSLNNVNYYPAATEAKIINYEMLARGFNCS